MFRARLVARLVMDVNVPRRKINICYFEKPELGQEMEREGKVPNDALK